eukprot:1157389-Pelagomonas_calceolata.AAC.4
MASYCKSVHLTQIINPEPLKAPAPALPPTSARPELAVSQPSCLRTQAKHRPTSAPRDNTSAQSSLGTQALHLPNHRDEQQQSSLGTQAQHLRTAPRHSTSAHHRDEQQQQTSLGTQALRLCTPLG